MTSVSEAESLSKFIKGLINNTQAGPNIVATAQTLTPQFGTAEEDRLKGTKGNDALFGGDAQDFFFGGRGDDLIDTGAGTDYARLGTGDDIAFGRSGDDRLWGDNGNDLLIGGVGRDRLYGGAGADSIYGGANADIIIGANGNDMIYAGAGNDAIRAGTHDDHVWGGEGNDKIWGGTGNDMLNGGAGKDKLYGGDGHDTLTGGGGINTLTGNAGADTFIFDGGTTTVTDFNLGTDQITLNGKTLNAANFGISPTGMLVDLATGLEIAQLADDPIDGLTISDETGSMMVTGLTIADLTLETTYPTDPRAPEGLDVVYGTQGSDSFTNGMHGDQVIYGLGGSDRFHDLDGNDHIFGGAGNDVYISAYNAKVETVFVYGGDDNDRFLADKWSNIGDVQEWFGGDGSDTFNISSAAYSHGSTVHIHDFELGVDQINFVLTNNFSQISNSWFGPNSTHIADGIIYQNGDIADAVASPIGTYTYNANGDLVIGLPRTTLIIDNVTMEDLGFSANQDKWKLGTNGDDILSTQSVQSSTQIYGREGDDTITGSNYNDKLYGAEGNDVIGGNGGDDSIYGGTGSDTLDGGTGNDLLDGGEGADTYIWNTGDGQDIAYGFDASEDIVMLNGLEFTSDNYALDGRVLSLVSTGETVGYFQDTLNGVRITIGDERLELRDADIAVDDFGF